MATSSNRESIDTLPAVHGLAIQDSLGDELAPCEGTEGDVARARCFGQP